ncbi:MAG: hypothetical protein AAF518_22925, partial [Spirochaetota bacterium]
MNTVLVRLQKNTFILLLPVILFFTYSCAYLVRSIIVVLLNPPRAKNVNVRPRRINKRNVNNKPLENYISMVEGNLIRGKLATSKNQENAEEEQAPTSIAQEAEPGSDSMRITGSLSGSRSFARTTIREKGQRESEEYAVYEEVGGYKIVSIQRNYIVLDRAGISLKVDVGETIGDARKRHLENNKSNSNATNGSALASSQTFKKIISREDVQRHFRNPQELYKHARFGPNLVPGGIDGYKLYQVGKKNPLYALGARSGDVIKRVNGMPLNKTEKML